MQVLVTGANGFVGRALLLRLQTLPTVQVVGSVRRSNSSPQSIRSGDAATVIVAGGLAADTDWSFALQGSELVVHSAARAHVMHETAHDPLAVYRRVNVQGTLNLARQAAEAGVRRFVFLSSIKVNGEVTPQGRAFTADDAPAPSGAYGVAKWEAEQGLWEVARTTGMEIVIIRPPLVYGPGVTANFGALMRAAQRRMPLPLGAVENRRSFVGLDNLVDFIVTCLTHERAANQTFLVSDGHDLSTRELVLGVAQAAGVRPILLPVPVWILRYGAALLGRSGMVQRLCGNLQVDISKAGKLLAWSPPVSVDEGLRRAVAANQLQ